MKLLACPKCHQQLHLENKTLKCENNHCYDISKRGYINLLLNPDKATNNPGDSKESLVARKAYLNKGYYDPILNQVITCIDEFKHQDHLSILDLGCGEGYYTSGFAAEEKYGFDMSKEALKHASKNDPSTQYAVASIFRLPLEDASCDTAVTCFAPFAKDEIERVLTQGGRFFFVSPGPKHLFELKQLIYDTPYENEMKDLETTLVKEEEYFISNTFHCEKEDVEFTAQGVKNLKTNELLTLKELGLKTMCGNNIETQVTVTHSSPFSPPPYMVGMVEIELDKETGQVDILDYVAVVDCGTVINTNLARVQTEGGLVQGIGMALYEDVQYTKRGAIPENSFMQYKIPTRLDMGKIRVEFESSYEPTGPFGAKSIGEIVINTPSPAIANAIYRATGKYLKDLPMTPEKILMAIDE